jgi:chitinase
MKVHYALSLIATALHTAAQNSNSTLQDDDPKKFYSQLHPCPDTCVGKPEDWTVYSKVERLRVCEQPILLDFTIYNSLDDPDTQVKLRTCTVGDAKDKTNVLAPGSEKIEAPGKIKRLSACAATAKASKVTLDISGSGDKGTDSLDDVHTILDKLREYLASQSNCEETFIAGYHKGVAVGVYSGASIDNQATVAGVLKSLNADSSLASAPKNLMLQLCGQDRNADHTLGIAIDNTGDLAAVQKYVAAWSNGTCADSGAKISQLQDVSISEIQDAKNTTISRFLRARSDCTTTTVVSGDSCGALASRCGISGADFTKYNPQSNLCSTLTPGQRVCCSSGTLPDITPKPNKDGSCASYTVKSGDTCSAIAANNGLKATDLATFNDKTTWGWTGCNGLMAGVTICLSKGTPPLPAPQSNAVCGPIKPGTKAPTDGTNITNLNPCPLNSCCDIWGQCGITPEFCTQETGPTGNPGTAPPGHNGCISNCGTKIANNGGAPSSFNKVGYYESWNWDRKCLNMRADTVDTSFYTHVHWGFATITSSFDVSVNDTYKQWSRFQSLSAKKVISFGGWGYSTDPSTYNMLRTAMSGSNANTFATNIVNFVNKNNLDGVDIDWEYPGAPDIPGIPAGLATDGPNYLSFLKTLKGKLPSGKTLSIAAPASFWYLKSFPIKDMATYLDYIVYMTYDLHGQWDYGNQFSQDGCPAGSCLRSHVNLTETNYALAMITKAGVPASKINVGISSYGRSFGMTKAGCTGPMCKYKGQVSLNEKD